MSTILCKNFDNLRSIFEDILKIKNSVERQHELAEKRKNASLLFVLIKKVNRMEKYGVRIGREQLHETKVQVDSNRLQLQNLLYEVGYLRREIRNCYQFKSQDEDIDLLAEKEYLSLAKAEAEPNPGTSKHQKRLLRLEGELNLRKDLSVQCKELANSKKQVLQDIVLKMERLSSFAPSLRTLAKATRPLQDALQVPLDKEWRLGRLVQMLPQPLYVAYMHIYAFEPELSAAIVGTEKDVHEVEVAAQTEQLAAQKSNDLEIQKKHILTPHPLTVQFTIGNKMNENECIVVSLRYFPHLEFATASSTHNLVEVDAEISASRDILKTLYEQDYGDNIPVPKGKNTIQKLGISPMECWQYLKLHEFGKPYRWVQRMCCIETYRQNNIVDTEVKLQEIIALTVKNIKDAWNSHLNLITQIRPLVSKNADFHLKNETLPVNKPTCSLVQWTALAREEYAANTCTDAYIEYGLVDVHNICYRAVVVRGSAKMECLISISNKFPAESPVWIISISWNGQHRSANCAAIKQMEFLTNSITQEQLQNEYALLAYQLYHTMYSFDIFLETEGPLHNPVEYSKEKNYLKSFAKRMRARPFRYIEDGYTASFKQ